MTTIDIPTAEHRVLPQQPQPQAEQVEQPDRGDVAARLAKTVPLVLTKRAAGEEAAKTGEDAENIFAQSEAILADWRARGLLDEDPRVAEVRQERLATLNDRTLQGAAIEVAKAKLDPLNSPEGPIDAATALENVDQADEGHLGDDIRRLASDYLVEQGRADLAVEVRDRLEYGEVYQEAIRQLTEENPGMRKREMKRLARRIAHDVVHDPSEGLFGMGGLPDVERRVSAPEGSLRRKAADFLRRAGAAVSGNKAFGYAQYVAGEAYRALQELPPNAKLVLGALGITAVAGTGIAYFTTQGAQLISDTIPNLEMFKQAETGEPGYSAREASR